MNGPHDGNFPSTLVNATVCPLQETIRGIAMKWKERN